MGYASVSTGAILRTFVLGGFCILLAWLTQTGDLAKFLNPRYRQLVELAGILLFLLTVIQATRIFNHNFSSSQAGKPTCSHNHNHQGFCLPFVFTLLVAFLLPNSNLDATMAVNKGLNSRLLIEDSYGRQSVPRPLARQLADAQLIQVNDINFTEVIFEISNFPQDYVGKEIELTGFVVKAPAFPDTHMALARYVVVCCTADAAPYGLLCTSNSKEQYAEGTWLKIHGTIKLDTHQNKSTPVITIAKADLVEKPDRPYVYPGYE